MSFAVLKRLTSEPSQPPGTYSPDILPLLQSLLRALADIDVEFQKDRETILKSPNDEPIKQRSIATLAKRHQQRRALYLRKIDKLERQIPKDVCIEIALSGRRHPGGNRRVTVRAWATPVRVKDYRPPLSFRGRPPMLPRCSCCISRAAATMSWTSSISSAASYLATQRS